MFRKACIGLLVSFLQIHALRLLSYGVLLCVIGPYSAVRAATIAPDRFNAVDYEFRLLKVPGARRISGVSLNDHGDVTGMATLRSGGTSPVTFIFRDGHYTIFTVPGADFTEPRSINNSADVVGYYIADSNEHGFIYRAGQIVTFDAPGAKDTDPREINTNGEVAGSFQDASTYHLHGFIYSNGTWNIIDWPGASNTIVRTINDLGQVAGDYQSELENGHGFATSNGLVTFDCPPGTMWTISRSINNGGQVMGECGVTGQTGLFVYRDGQLRRHALKRAAFLSPKAMNDRGEIAGEYGRTRGRSHGFLFRRGHFFRVDVPGARATIVNDINASGQLTGYFTDSSGRHGFLATPKSKPSTLEAQSVDPLD